MQSVYYEVNGIRLHALTDGDDAQETILFLHGFPEFSYAWHEQLPFFVQKGFRVCAPDLRGYNLSSKPKGKKAYVIDHLVADVVGLINQISSDGVIVVAHDWGGGVAWALAMQHPAVVKKLIILNMPHLQVMLDNLKRNPRQMLKSWYAAFFQVPLLPELLCRIFNFRFLKNSLLKTSNRGTFSREDLQQYRSAWRQPYALTAMINWYRAFKQDALKSYPKVTVPTLIIWGKKDATLSAEMASQSVAQCTNGKLVMLNDATHWLHHEKPNEINQLIWGFVKG
ncbi:alpha/beta hydrolase [Mucilaginibacter sp. Bleaf8]|uniref:alpha/beta fold hydrolase n=1 Tax=Mucilaginibacter sp. Bleaf8 TaxID=2834430 RepID=UPI001BCFDA89|nr:alpha/beta hydrolase [Mucilaginibacter sp. Bleaf8]MBS7562983.1 alpha/beta hydrolase [Mucilaginibacter sp. Bleaf8]